MRGTLCALSLPIFSTGIIPAYAGNTSERPASALTIRDHPRVCGEHQETWKNDLKTMGSSPRMRGTPQANGRPACTRRIIPAYAGNTGSAACCTRCGRDHPRVCGEHMSVHFYAGYWQGSSPRMRGTLSVRNDSELGPRIIPAYAGNTEKVAAVGLDGRDHPRVCGEHSKCAYGARYSRGIIPAYAGNTGHTRSTWTRAWDHPRVCGEHTSTADSYSST